ncbi:MAG: hypothetical protein AAB602_01965 [Patescibacteria group bacterium]
MQEIKNYLSDITVRRRRRRIFAIIGLLCAVIFLLTAGGSWFFISSPFFQIEKIIITGNTFVSQSDAMSLLRATIITGAWWKSLLGLENILVWPDTLSQAGNPVFYPAVKNVSISKNYFKRTVSVRIEERESIGTWCFQKTQISDDVNADERGSAQKIGVGAIGENPRINLRESTSVCWLFDDEGIIFKRSPSTEGNLLMIVRDYSQKAAGLNSKIIAGQYMENFLSIIRVIRESSLGLKEMVIKNLALEEVEVLTRVGAAGTENPKFYFSLRFPANGALAAIESLYAKPGFKNLEYIDFRVENKVYYK